MLPSYRTWNILKIGPLYHCHTQLNVCEKEGLQCFSYLIQIFDPISNTNYLYYTQLNCGRKAWAALPFDRHAASLNVTAKGSKLVLSNLTSALVLLLFENRTELRKSHFQKPNHHPQYIVINRLLLYK